ncbi:MAG: hypothetical protein E7372_05240 [Clostridiales bacterium]|nr:hypothetical protein [Clostridiales bacterium]
MWGICLNLSISIALIVLIAIVVLSFTKIATKKRFNLNYLFIIGFFIVGFILFLPIFSFRTKNDSLSIFQTIVLSCMNALKLFVSGCEYGDISEIIALAPQNIAFVYQIWFLLLFIFTPVYTIGFILSFFKNIRARIQYLASWNKDVYIFSSLNEKSFNLAKDIKLNNKKAVVVFTGFDKNEEKNSPYIFDLQAIGCIFFYKNLFSIDFSNHSQKRKITFFTIDFDESKNLKDGLKIIDTYKHINNVNLYIFSTQIDSGLLLASANKGKINVRRINEVQSLISSHIYENGKTLFESAIEKNGTDKEISVLIVGLGKYGTEMLKTLSWYCQMDGYHLTINAFDKQENALEKLKGIAPELLSTKYNGKEIDGEARYKINVYSGINVKEQTFKYKIEEIKEVSYVFVCLGDDNLNIETAIELRSLFERIHTHPIIQTIVNNSLQKKSLQNLKNYSGQDFDIDYIGDIESIYCQKVIINSELEQKALKQHLKWGKEEEFWNYEYNYRSSLATTIHLKARIMCGIKGAHKKTNQLTDEEKVIIEKLEHRRWNAYMRSEGYVYSGSLDEKSRNNLAKTHHNLVPYDLLSQKDKKKDSDIGTI